MTGAFDATQALDKFCHQAKEEGRKEVGELLWLCSSDLFVQATFGNGLLGSKGLIELIERGAVRAQDLGVSSHIKKNMGVILWRCSPDTLEFLDADFDCGDAFVILEMWD